MASKKPAKTAKTSKASKATKKVGRPAKAEVAATPKKKRGGRKPGSKNKPKAPSYAYRVIDVDASPWSLGLFATANAALDAISAQHELGYEVEAGTPVSDSDIETMADGAPNTPTTHAGSPTGGIRWTIIKVRVGRDDVVEPNW